MLHPRSSERAPRDVEAQASRFVRVVLADDHSILPGGCRPRLDGEPRVVVVGETSDAADVVSLVRRVVPRVVVIATGPDASTAELVAATCAAAPTSDVVVVSSRDDETYVGRVLRAGARGYVRADDTALGRAVRAVAAGGAYFSPEVATVLRDGYVRGDGIALEQLLHRVSDVDRAVLRGVLDGLSDVELAAELELAVDAVHRSRMRLVALLASGGGPDARDDGPA